VSISADRPDKAARALLFLQEKHASTRNYIFSSEDKYALIDAVDPQWEGALPYTILVEPGGKVVWKSMGTFDFFELKKVIVDHEMIGRYF
jgi:hypothetical protein